MKSCNHYTTENGKYKSLINHEANYYICKQCNRLMNKNDASLLDEYCSLQNMASRMENGVGKDVLESRIFELITWLHPRFPYREKKSENINEYINPFFN